MASDNDNEFDLEYSLLCGDVTRDGLTVRVQIYRIAGRGEGWSLEVVDHQDAHHDAYRAGRVTAAA